MYLPIYQHYSLYYLLVGLNECDYVRKMLNKNYLGKVPSRAAKAEKLKDLRIRNFDTYL